MTKSHTLIAIFAGTLFLTGCRLQKNQPTPSPIATQMEQSSENGHSTMTSITNENEFIAQMIPHHNEAIEASVLIATQTADLDLKVFAKSVAVVQSKEVEQMEKWQAEWFKNATGSAQYHPMMGDLHNISPEKLDSEYVKGMIAHHQGAVDMANQVLTLNPREEIQTLAESIVSTQQAEIELLKGWLEAHP